MREKPILFIAPMVRAILAGHKTQTRRIVEPQPLFVGRPKWLGYSGDMVEKPEGFYLLAKSCPYAPGDRLWMREAFGYNQYGGVVYAGDPGQERVARKMPSICMPRWASRITLDVVSVRVERVQEIDEDGALAEGVNSSCVAHAVPDFACLWDSINAKRHPWASNPWVWVIEFRKLEGNA